MSVPSIKEIEVNKLWAFINLWIFVQLWCSFIINVSNEKFHICDPKLYNDSSCQELKIPFSTSLFLMICFKAIAKFNIFITWNIHGIVGYILVWTKISRKKREKTKTWNWSSITRKKPCQAKWRQKRRVKKHTSPICLVPSELASKL